MALEYAWNCQWGEEMQTISNTLNPNSSISTLLPQPLWSIVVLRSTSQPLWQPTLHHHCIKQLSTLPACHSFSFLLPQNPCPPSSHLFRNITLGILFYCTINNDFVSILSIYKYDLQNFPHVFILLVPSLLVLLTFPSLLPLLLLLRLSSFFFLLNKCGTWTCHVVRLVIFR